MSVRLIFVLSFFNKVLLVVPRNLTVVQNTNIVNDFLSIVSSLILKLYTTSVTRDIWYTFLNFVDNFPL